MLTRPPVRSSRSLYRSRHSLSADVARRRGGRCAMEAGAFEHLPAEGLRAVPTALLGRKIRRLRRAESDSGKPLHSAAGALWWLK